MGLLSAREDEWVACPVCGHANRPHKIWKYRACPRCFHDAKTGEYDAGQAQQGKLGLLGVYAGAAMAGFAAAALLIVPVVVYFDLARESMATIRLYVIGGIFSVAIAAAMWITDRQRVRGGFHGRPPAPLPMPPGASIRKRIDGRYARPLMGAVVGFFGIAFPLGVYLERAGYSSVFTPLVTLIVIPAVGAAAGHAYDLWRRGGGGR